mmetsp:Transcript_68659/g.150043  ORF Transcript_68659/g.150043 Transcript_68659/m.150043 type:complete len:476 (-) Transcript_68659:390-1817(-)
MLRLLKRLVPGPPGTEPTPLQEYPSPSTLEGFIGQAGRFLGICEHHLSIDTARSWVQHLDEALANISEEMQVQQDNELSPTLEDEVANGELEILKQFRMRYLDLESPPLRGMWSSKAKAICLKSILDWLECSFVTRHPGLTATDVGVIGDVDEEIQRASPCFPSAIGEPAFSESEVGSSAQSTVTTSVSQSQTTGSWTASSHLQASTGAPQYRQTVPDTIPEDEQELGGGHTLLHQAAMDGDLAKVKSLLQESREDLNRQDSGGDTPLILAAHHGYEDVVQFLCSQADCDLFLQNLRGMTALDKAWRQGNNDVAAILWIEANARNDPRRWDGTCVPSPLEEAMILGHFEDMAVLAVDPVTSRPDWGSVISIANSDRRLMVVKYLVEKEKVDINTKANDGETPLHKAAGWGRMEVVKYLVEADADVNVEDDNGKTPLDRVCSSMIADVGYEEAIESILRAAGARSRRLEGAASCSR